MEVVVASATGDAEYRQNSSEAAYASATAAALVGHMQRRAAVMRACAPNMHIRRRIPHMLNDSIMTVLATGDHRFYDQVIFCPSHRLAFVHIFKAAGTTVMSALRRVCKGTLIHLYIKIGQKIGQK